MRGPLVWPNRERRACYRKMLMAAGLQAMARAKWAWGRRSAGQGIFAAIESLLAGAHGWTDQRPGLAICGALAGLAVSRCAVGVV